jgi:hypothetical protein
MQITFGHDFFDARNGRRTPVVFDTAKLINAHVLLVGSSGVGKSFTIMRMIKQAAASSSDVRFHVFDVHGDLRIDGASEVQFSEQAPFGLNPLKVNPDPHFGGVRKCIQAFIRTVNQASATALGVKQEAVLRNLLVDVYREFGFEMDNPSTWAVTARQTRLVSGGADNRLYLKVPLAEKDRAKAFGARWDPEKKLWWTHTENYRGELTRWEPAFEGRRYPTIADVAAYARRVHVERFLGSDQKAVRALEELSRKAQSMQKKLLEAVKVREHEGFDEELENALQAQRDRAVEAYAHYVNSIRTGHELENLIKYDSADVLKSVVDRLSNLQATGIFKSTLPPFDRASAVWRYKLNALSVEEKKMLVLFTLQDIFNRAVQRGEHADVAEVVVLDELGTYTSAADAENGDGIIGTIAREARKFGLALWAASQTPANVPESLVSSVGTKVILGLDEMYWNAAVTKLRIERRLLEWIRPHKTIAVQMKEKAALRNRWWWVQL